MYQSASGILLHLKAFPEVLYSEPYYLTCHAPNTPLRMLFIALSKAMDVFAQGLNSHLCVLNLVNPRDRGCSTATRIMSNTRQPPHGQPDVRSKLQLFEYQPLSILERWQARQRGFARLPPPSSPEVPDAFLQVLLSRRKRCDGKRKTAATRTFLKCPKCTHLLTVY